MQDLHNQRNLKVENRENGNERVNHYYRIKYTRNPTLWRICLSSSQDDPAICKENKKTKENMSKMSVELVHFGLVMNPILWKIFEITLSVALRHHSSNSCKPAFKYSPLLKEQHSRRSNKLRNHKYKIKLNQQLLVQHVKWNWVELLFTY
jgi:hypothetical protein